MANELLCKCKNCAKVWEEPQNLPMEMTEWTKAVKKIRCPHCQSAKLSILFGEAASAELGVPSSYMPPKGSNDAS